MQSTNNGGNKAKYLNSVSGRGCLILKHVLKHVLKHISRDEGTKAFHATWLRNNYLLYMLVSEASVVSVPFRLSKPLHQPLRSQEDVSQALP